MSRYQWSIRAVDGHKKGGPMYTIADFADELQRALNDLESDEFEIDDILDAPGGREEGVIVIGKKPRRFPSAA